MSEKKGKTRFDWVFLDVEPRTMLVLFVLGFALSIQGVMEALDEKTEPSPPPELLCVQEAPDLSGIQGSLEQLIINQANIMVVLSTCTQECAAVIEHVTAVEVVPLPPTMR